MKFVMIANGGRDCRRSDIIFESKNVAEAKKEALEYFDEFYEYEEVRSITLLRVSGEYEITKEEYET